MDDFLLADAINKSMDPYAEMKYEIILELLRERQSMRVLNVGCGSGELSFKLGVHGHTVHSIDISDSYIQVALRRKRESFSDMQNVGFQVTSIEDLVCADAFDCIVATDVLEHIDDDGAALAKMATLLNPGGILILTVPAMEWLFGFHDVCSGHLRRYSKEGLARLVGKRFEIEFVRYVGFALVPASLIYSKILRRPYPQPASGSSNRNSALRILVSAAFCLDKVMPMPLGTSLILSAVKQS